MEQQMNYQESAKQAQQNMQKQQYLYIYNNKRSIRTKKSVFKRIHDT